MTEKSMKKEARMAKMEKRSLIRIVEGEILMGLKVKCFTSSIGRPLTISSFGGVEKQIVTNSDNIQFWRCSSVNKSSTLKKHLDNEAK